MTAASRGWPISVELYNIDKTRLMLTRHAQERMRERDVSRNDLKKCMETPSDDNKFYHRDITVIMDGVDVITVWRSEHSHHTAQKRDLANIRQQKRLHKYVGKIN